MLLTISAFILAVVVLFASGAVLVRTIVWMGRYFSMSEYALAFVLVSFATTLPEFFVGMSSAAAGTPELSLGNIIGSSVLDIALVLGTVILVGGGMKMNHVVAREDITLAFGMIMLPVLLALDGVVSRADGAILILMFLGYIHYLATRSRVTGVVELCAPGEYCFRNFFHTFWFFILSAVMLLGSAALTVSIGRDLALAAGLSVFFVGVLVGFGTTMPELVFGITSIYLKRSSMSLGNIIGSILTKASFVLGAVALISPIVIARPASVFVGLFLSAFLIVVIQFTAYVRDALPRAFGVFLFLMGVLFLIFEALA